MTQKLINLGSGINTKDGDNIRLAFSKVNDNFAEIYTSIGPSIIPNFSAQSGKYLSNNGVDLVWVDISNLNNGFVTSQSLEDTLSSYTTQTQLSVALSTAAVTHLVNGQYEVDLNTNGIVDFSLSSNGKAVLRSSSDLQITAGAYTFTFTADGKIKLPTGGDIVDSSNVSVLGGGGGSSGSINIQIDGGFPSTVFNGTEVVIDGGLV
jgi:hypothetical protein